MIMKKQTQILLSFVGSNDGGKLLGKPDGDVLTALKNEKFVLNFLISNL